MLRRAASALGGGDLRRLEFVEAGLGERRQQMVLAREMVVGRGLRLTIAGIFLGGIAALMLTRLMGNLLYKVDPHDPIASLTERARAYLHANCSHCHARNAGGNSLMQLASDIAENDMAIFNAVPMHATFGIDEKPTSIG